MTAAVLVAVLLAVLLAGALVAVAVLLVRLRVARRRLLVLEEAMDQLAEPPERRPRRSLAAAERAVRTVVGTAAKVRERGVGTMLMSSLDDLSRWASEDRGAIAGLGGPDGEVAIMFSDIEGSTSMNDRLGDEDFVHLLIAHDAMIRLHVERRGGHVVKSQGDGFMVAFAKPTHAVRCALDIQRSFSQIWSRALRRPAVSVRIGVHTGPVVTRGDDVFGLNVAIAARVAAEAVGGQILVTQPVADALADHRRISVRLERDAELRGVPGRHALWSVRRSKAAPAAS